ncbi:D-aspartate oxidase-like [Zeugodacus cucurbitae]|uniref:D-aspartate oxidase-like n=1 Tax=Zeugodacus cucurbitae TaxID=28588 RepID=UPI0023D92231|nr:D-aspartate oxidase-like [Zeugodacus cucurbitae]
MRIAVIGGGVNGISSAVQILEYLKSTGSPADVTVLSEAFSPNTTGDGSAGLWGPFLLSGTPTARVHRWSKHMHDFLAQIWLSEDAGEAGVCLLPCLGLTTTNMDTDVFWKDIVYGCRRLTQKQLDQLNVGRAKKYTEGIHYITYTSEPAKLLPYLMKRFQANGGKIVQQKITNLEEFITNSEYEVIINCTGLGSRECVKDNGMFPIRGQVSRVKANWLYYAFMDESDDGNYIIPNYESVVLGGTHQKNDYNTKVCPNDKAFIVNGCRDMLPSLENAQHLSDWVGLRPGRDALRLEAEKGGKKIIIHNYGHGGAGVTLAWGCAKEVLELLKHELEARNFVKSKL